MIRTSVNIFNLRLNFVKFDTKGFIIFEMCDVVVLNVTCSKTIHFSIAGVQAILFFKHGQTDEKDSIKARFFIFTNIVCLDPWKSLAKHGWRVTKFFCITVYATLFLFTQTLLYNLINFNSWGVRTFSKILVLQ